MKDKKTRINGINPENQGQKQIGKPNKLDPETQKWFCSHLSPSCFSLTPLKRLCSQEQQDAVQLPTPTTLQRFLSLREVSLYLAQHLSP